MIGKALKKDSKQTQCLHCETPFVPHQNEPFCCSGCQYVYQLLNEQALDEFYSIKGNRSLPPIGESVFQHHDFEWVAVAQKEAELIEAPALKKAKFQIEGMSCIACVWLIDALFKREEGQVEIQINLQQGAVTLYWNEPEFDLTHFAKSLSNVGYQLRPDTTHPSNDTQTLALSKRIGLCGFLLMNTMLFTLPGYLGMQPAFFLSPLFQILGAFFATLSVLIGGTYFFNRAWQALSAKVLHIDFPISLGIIAAYFGSLVGWLMGYPSLIYFDFVASFIFLMLVGRWVQEFALERNRNLLNKKERHLDPVILLNGSNDGEAMDPDAVVEGQVYQLKPRSINPVAAELLEPNCSVSLEWINGESKPTIWSAHKILPAGSINIGLNSITLKARESWDDGILSEMLATDNTEYQDSRLQKVLKYYIWTILWIAGLGGFAWMFFTSQVLTALQVSISVLIVSCPCALGVAIPICNSYAHTRLRHVGLFIKSNLIWSRLNQVKRVVFDKTGTLTLSTPELINPEAIQTLNNEVRNALFYLVDRNAHPVARSLRECLLKNDPNLIKCEKYPEIEETLGEGVSFCDREMNLWSLGKAVVLNTDTESAENYSVAHFSKNKTPIVSFQFSEKVRDHAFEVIQSFKKNGFDPMILSGDHSLSVEKIAHSLELDSENYKSNYSPKDKSKWIEANALDSALMVGDGANDRFAFDSAICRGVPVTEQSLLQESADFFFFGKSLQSLPLLIATHRKRNRTVHTIFAVAIIYNCGAIGLCLWGFMHPLIAAILMPLSSLLSLLIAWVGLSPKNLQ